jgi:hypothetical protein
MEFDLENPFTCSDEEASPPSEEMHSTASSASVESLFAAESDHSPAAGDIFVRRFAASFIFQVLKCSTIV